MLMKRKKDKKKMKDMTKFFQALNDDEFMTILVSECKLTGQIENLTEQEVKDIISYTGGKQTVDKMVPCVGNALITAVKNTKNEGIKEFMNDFKYLLQKSQNRGAISGLILKFTGVSFGGWFGLVEK